MKIGILTHFDVNNQGAQLQMFASYNWLKDHNFEPVVLTYKKNFDFVPTNEIRNQISIKSIPYIIKEFLVKKGIGLTLFNTKKYLINKQFREESLVCADYKDKGLDAIVIGSDECLSLESGCNQMMYGHGCNCKNIIYYAPSFGQTTIEDIKSHNCYEIIESGVKSIKRLSARDEHTQELLSVFCPDKNIKLVCDPVLLYGFNSTVTKARVPRQKYILIYGYDKNFTDIKEIDAIKQFAKKNKLLTVSAGTYHKWCDKNYNCNCLEWLEYFRNAEYVITDTFHGSVLSMNFNKKMCIKIRSKINSNKLTALINDYYMTDRQIEDITCDNLEKILYKDIDFTEINKKISEERERAKEYLLGALNERID